MITGTTMKKMFVTINILAVSVTTVYICTAYLEKWIPNPACYTSTNAISRYLHMKLGQKYSRYMVYLCEKDRSCGEWPERLQGMAMAHMLSRLTKRRFGILSANPVRLDAIMEPNYEDWRFDEMKQIHGSCAVYDFPSAQQFNEMLKHADLNEQFSEDIVYIRLSWFSWKPLNENPRYRDQLKQIGKNIAGGFFRMTHDILRPNEAGSKMLDVYHHDLKRSSRHILICALVGPQTGTQLDADSRDALWAYIDQNLTNMTMFALSTRDTHVLEESVFKFSDHIRWVFGPANSFDQPGEPQDRRVNSMKQAILDYYALLRCDKLILSCGNSFGTIVAFARNRDEHLFYLHKGKITKTSLGTIANDHTEGKCMNVRQ